ncbi:GGDEF domain-containing protein [Permianibacter sp. IMCC34836]|uniref:GGDEF domain-containing protein n=1 Tax=Permianibacter fluminis TaxID=2738515 RepID=UPI001553AEE1|nr:GGDEF domain-containing protein [Permianibacter fluminis]NQD38832.1 GGDEF domain-containing protein [Permianibacter fluminis]
MSGQKQVVRGRQLAFHLIALAAITPFGLSMVWQGALLSGSVTLLACAAIAISTWLIWRQRALLFAHLLGCLVPSLAVLYFIPIMPIYATMWSYPMVVFFYLYLELRLAILFNLLFAAGLAVLAWSALAMDLYSRLLVTHFVVGGMTLIFARTVAKQQQELQQAANTDSLTGLANRRAVQQALENWQRQRSRYGVPATLLLIDLDHFKSVNDQGGHQAGDQVLMQVAAILRRRARDTDMAGRWGGEEFVLVLPHTHGRDGMAVAETLRSSIAELRPGAPTVPMITTSIGVAELLAHDTPESWIARADAALYQAKAAGRDRVVMAADDSL